MVPLVDYLAAWKLLPNVCPKRLLQSVWCSTATFQHGHCHTGWSRQGSDNETRTEYPLEEGCHRGDPSSRQRVWVLQPVLHRSQEGWMVASYFRSESTELLSHATEVQDALYRAGCVSDPIRGLVCRDRSKRRIFPHLHPSPSQWVPEVCFGGKAYQNRVLPFGLALSPCTFTKCVDAALVPLWLQGILILNLIDSEQMEVRHDRIMI